MIRPEFRKILMDQRGAAAAEDDVREERSGADCGRGDLHSRATQGSVHERSPQPGDVFVLNAPYAGGTHLPDVTLVMPVGSEQ